MTKTSHTARTAIAFFDGTFASLAILDLDQLTEIVTCAAYPGCYIKIDDGRHYAQICEGGSTRGSTLCWSNKPESMGEAFARGCRAKLYKTQAGYDNALAVLKANAVDWRDCEPEAFDFA